MISFVLFLKTLLIFDKGKRTDEEIIATLINLENVTNLSISIYVLIGDNPQTVNAATAGCVQFAFS